MAVWSGAVKSRQMRQDLFGSDSGVGSRTWRLVLLCRAESWESVGREERGMSGGPLPLAPLVVGRAGFGGGGSSILPELKP